MTLRKYSLPRLKFLSASTFILAIILGSFASVALAETVNRPMIGMPIVGPPRPVNCCKDKPLWTLTKLKMPVTDSDNYGR